MTAKGWIGSVVCLAGLAAMSAKAEMVVLEGVDASTPTTGDLLDEVGEAGATTNVVEIAGLAVTARSGGAGQKINVTSTSLGVTIYGAGDDTDAFDDGEGMVLSFDKAVRINRIDFNGFESNETFVVEIEGQPGLVIPWTHLGNKSQDYIDTDVLVPAYTEMLFHTQGGSVVGLDGIDLSVVGGTGRPGLSFGWTNGTGRVAVAFDGAPGTNYILQQCGTLASNTWIAISAPFSTNGEWVVDATDATGFFRAVEEGP